MSLDDYCVTVTGACGTATQCAQLRAIANTIVELATQAIAEIDVASEDLAQALQRYDEQDKRPR